MIIKRFLMALLLVGTLFSATPKNANAGIIIGSAGVITGYALLPLGGGPNAEYGPIVTSVVAPMGIGSIVVGSILMYFNPAIGVVLIVLDENKHNISQNDLENVLAARYPFINDQSVIADLATLVQSKLNLELKKNKDFKEISLSRKEIESLLKRTDLMETESQSVESMINDLI